MKGFAIFWFFWGIANAAWLAVLLTADGLGTTFSITLHSMIVVWSAVMFLFSLKELS